MTRMEIIINALKRDFDVTITVSKYSPGDGWSRYGVSANSWNDIKEGMTKAECEAYLQGMYDMQRVRDDDAKRLRRTTL